MITPKILEMLHESIQIYDKLCGKNFFLIFGSKNKYKFIELTIQESSFWHLLGCSLDEDTNQEKANTYQRCKNKEDVSDKISSIHGFSEITKKYEAMKNVFDFIKNANNIKICYAVNCPEEYLFTIGAGNDTGIIGYDYPNKGYSNLLFPKSAQLKPISKLSKKNPDKIFMILSKKISMKHYNTIEYEVKKDIYPELIKHIPDRIKISSNIL